MGQRRNLCERGAEQSPLLKMIRQSDCEEQRDNGNRAEVAPPSTPLERVWIDKAVRRRAAEPNDVAVLEFLPATNLSPVDEGAVSRLEIDDIVTATRIADECVTIGDVGVGEPQSRPFGAADRRFIALEQQ